MAERLLERKIRTTPAYPDDGNEDPSPQKPELEIIQPQNTLQNIPKKYIGKVEAAVEAILAAFDPNYDENWVMLYDKNGKI